MVPPLLPVLSKARARSESTHISTPVYSRINVLNPPCLILGECYTHSCVLVILADKALVLFIALSMCNNYMYYWVIRVYGCTWNKWHDISFSP